MLKQIRNLRKKNTTLSQPYPQTYISAECSISKKSSKFMSVLGVLPPTFQVATNILQAQQWHFPAVRNNIGLIICTKTTSNYNTESIPKISNFSHWCHGTLEIREIQPFQQPTTFLSFWEEIRISNMMFTFFLCFRTLPILESNTNKFVNDKGQEVNIRTETYTESFRSPHM